MFSFKNTKYLLFFLNIAYFLAGASLLYICARAKFSNPPVEFVSAERVILFCEIFTILLAVIGTYAVFRHHQVIMFFYIIILIFLLFLEGNFSFKTLKGFNEDKGETVWNQMNTIDKNQFMEDNGCYPHDDHINFTDIPASIHLPCLIEATECHLCSKKLANIFMWWNNLIGYWGLGCSFAKVPGVFLTRHYRNLKDPRSHSSAFL